MPTYRTRMLIAQTDLTLGRDHIEKDAVFAATDVDADYLIGQKKAVEHGEVALPSDPAAKSAKAVPAVVDKPAQVIPAPFDGTETVLPDWDSTAPIETTLSDEYPAPSELAVEATPKLDRTALIAQAEAAGKTIDRRWSTQRIADELAGAKKA